MDGALDTSELREDGEIDTLRTPMAALRLRWRSKGRGEMALEQQRLR